MAKVTKFLMGMTKSPSLLRSGPDKDHACGQSFGYHYSFRQNYPMESKKNQPVTKSTRKEKPAALDEYQSYRQQRNELKIKN